MNFYYIQSVLDNFCLEFIFTVQSLIQLPAIPD